MTDPDLLAMAQDELARACELGWRELAPIVPWGDEFEGLSPGGAPVLAARSYIWSGQEGGDILCEVTVYRGASRHQHGAHVTQIIPKA